MRRSVIAIATMALVLAACGGGTTTTTAAESAGTSGGGTVVFFGYEDSFLPDVLEPFEEATGIDVKTPAFADEDETEAKLRAGFEADVVELCSGEAGAMIEAGLLQPVDTGRIDDWDAIFPSFKEGEDVVDEDGNVWIVPLQGGPFGIVYLADEVEPITSYEQLFFGDYEGDIAVSEEPVSTIWDMAMALGYGPRVDEITNDQVVDAVYVAPAEGQILWKCGHGLAANAKNLDAAYRLINHYLSPEMQLVFAEEYGYLASNSKILDVAPPELVEELRLDDPGAVDQVTIPEGLPDDEEFWDEQWQRFAG